jgi:hypothetical protein
MRPARLAALGLALLAAPLTLHADGRSDLARRYIARYGTSAATAHWGSIPSFSRQTGLACTACHTAFPQLTPFGRLFKLNGYTLTGLRVLGDGEEDRRPSLKLDVVPPVSAMVVGSYTQVGRDLPGTQNGGTQLPQELSLFIGEAITPNLGTFAQVTYLPGSGTIGIDNLDIRYAGHAAIRGRQLLFGVTLNNAPTVQDPWNTTPVWRFPFVSSPTAPGPAARPLLDDALAQRVAGLGAYGLWDNLLYAEVSAYRTAVAGGPPAPDSTSTGTIKGAAPYWRLALEHQWTHTYAEVGAFGMTTALWPAGVGGSTDRFADVGVDAQFERRLGGGSLALHGSWLHEDQRLNGSAAAGAAVGVPHSLEEFRVDASVLTRQRLGLTAGYFRTAGTADAFRYPAAPVFGSANGSPNSEGLIFELTALPWLNTRFGAQYVAYGRFNGRSVDYDGSGRDAADNNALYLFTWLAF